MRIGLAMGSVASRVLAVAYMDVLMVLWWFGGSQDRDGMSGLLELGSYCSMFQ